MTAGVQPALDGTIPPAPRVLAAIRRTADYQTWLDEVRPVFEAFARTGRRATSYEIAEEYDLPEPPNPKAHWGQAVHHFASTELIECVGYDDTTRPGGDHSAVKVWRGTRAARRGRAA